MTSNAAELEPDYDFLVRKARCEESHLDFTRYFFKSRHSLKFIVNWHHMIACDAIQEVMDGAIDNLVFNVAPGSSKTEIFIINTIARGLARNPFARFLHLSGSDSLASLNSASARELVRSDEFQRFWPMRIAEDADSKKRWNVVINGKTAGGVYATAIGGQVTGFRAGHMTEGFQGAILIDDPLKPEDAFSKIKVDAVNRKILTTIQSRKANPKTPMILVMQRVGENDPTGFIEKGNVPGRWKIVKIPAVIDDNYIEQLRPRYRDLVDRTRSDGNGRYSYWPYKEPLKQLLKMERGEGTDQNGARISRHVFYGQYQQSPTILGGNIIKGECFTRYKVLPRIITRKIFADTAQKTKEVNDYSVFAEFGLSKDGRLYLIDLIRGRWEATELQNRAIAFWAKAKARDRTKFGTVRKLMVEDKSSGTGLIQTLEKPPHNIPVEGIERDKDKFSRAMDAVPYIEVGAVCVPEDAAFTSDFLSECEAFTADDSHAFDDQCDVLFDGVADMLGNDKIEQWKQLGKKGEA